MLRYWLFRPNAILSNMLMILHDVFLSIFFLDPLYFSNSSWQFFRLLLPHQVYICSSTLHVKCFCHAAFCSLLFFFVVSLIVFMCGHISTISLHGLLFSLFFPLMNSQSFFYLMMVHCYLNFSVRQFDLLFYLFFFSQCCYNLWAYCFPLIFHRPTVVAIITISTILFLFSTMDPSLLLLLYLLVSPKL